VLYTGLCSCRFTTHFIWKKFSSGSYAFLSLFPFCLRSMCLQCIERCLQRTVCEVLTLALFSEGCRATRACIQMAMCAFRRRKCARSVEESAHRVSQNIASFGTFLCRGFDFPPRCSWAFALQWCYAEYFGSWLPLVPVDLYDTSVTDYQPTPHNILEEPRPSNFCL